MDLPVYVAVGISNGTLYALMALGLVLTYKTQNFIPFVNGEFFTAGAFAAFTVFKVLALPYWAALCVAVLCGAAIGFICEQAIIRPLANSHHLSLVMATVGASILLQGIARLRWGDDIYTFPPLLSGMSVTLLGVPIALQNLVVIVMAVVLVGALFLFFTFTKMGKQVKAVSQSLVGAQIIGINPARVYRTTWMLSGAIGAVAGVLAAPFTLLYPDMGSEILIKGFAAAILGGLTSIPGALVGGLIIGVSEMLIAGYISTVFVKISAFVVIMVVLLVKPHGLFGTNTTGRV
jgi:branched-chain amino acid transport system permease protein